MVRNIETKEKKDIFEELYFNFPCTLMSHKFVLIILNNYITNCLQNVSKKIFLFYFT